MEKDVKIFASSIDGGAVNQVYEIANLDAFEGSKIRIMSDAHKGAGCVIGFTGTYTDKIVPNITGVDLNCLDRDTEFLTPYGWKKISDYKFSDIILQYDKDTQEAFFKRPNAYIVQPCDDFYHFKNSKGLDQMVSKEHKMLIYKGYKKRGFKMEVVNPVFFENKRLDKNYYNIPTSFNIKQKGIDFSDNEIRFLIAVSADGCIRCSHIKDDNHRVEFHLKKERKITRLKDILDKLEIGYSICNGKHGDVYINVVCNKKFSKNLNVLWKANFEQLKIVSEECLLWDGHVGYRSQFNSTDKQNADIIQFAFHATGIRAGIYTVKSHKKEVKNSYSVIPTRNDKIGITNYKKVSSVDGKKYCFNTDTGYFVIRRNNNISITGNCGMLTVNLGKIDIDLPKLDKFIRTNIPMGRRVNEKKHGGAEMLVLGKRIEEMHCYNELKEKDRLLPGVGSLGGGNHFLEIDEDDEGNKYLVIHSGSRNLGAQVARIYQNIAIRECHETFTSKEEIKEIADRLKKQGRQKDIPDAISEYSKSKAAKAPHLAKDVCYLEGESMKNYIEDIQVCKMYANMSRRYMAEKIINYIFSDYGAKKNSNAYIEADCFTSGYDDNEVDIRFESFETLHNYVDTDAKIIRKGAIRALEGERVLIPINMRDGSLICVGKGNIDWNNSAPHGAGRLLSRSEAKEKIKLEDFKETMKDVYSSTVDQSTIDESPFAYKPIEVIMNDIQDTVTIEKIIRPIYNCKASGSDVDD